MHHFISLLYALGFDTNPILCLLGSGLHSRGFYTEEIVSAHFRPRPIIYCTMYIQRFWEVFVSTDTYYIRVGIEGRTSSSKLPNTPSSMYRYQASATREYHNQSRN